MESSADRLEQMFARKNRSRAQRLECRQCGGVCERVVSPWRCLKSRYPCVYAYELGETTFFGCLHKVFSPELDLAAFVGGGSSGGGETDPYGPIRATRPPRPHCPVSIERAYLLSGIHGDCSNPAFFRGVRIAPGGVDGTVVEPRAYWLPDTQG